MEDKREPKIYTLSALFDAKVIIVIKLPGRSMTNQITSIFWFFNETVRKYVERIWYFVTIIVLTYCEKKLF